jgi:hypothetical protein
MHDVTQRIIEKCRELDRIDRECIELSYESSKPQNEEQFIDYLSELMGISARAFELKNEIQMFLREADNLTIHDANLADLIRKIRNDEKFYSITQYERIASFFNTKVDEPSDAWDIDSHDFILQHPEAFQGFHGEVDYVEYFTRSMKVGGLIAQRRVPDSALAYFREIRDSFSFGLHRSAIALCRAMLESVFFDALKRRSYLTAGGSKVVKIDLAKEDRLFRMIKDAHSMRIIDYDTKEDAFFVKNQANAIVLHAKDSKPEITEEVAFDVIQRTIRVIERLYAT